MRMGRLAGGALQVMRAPPRVIGVLWVFRFCFSKKATLSDTYFEENGRWRVNLQM